MRFDPDVMTMRDGTFVTNASQWEARRREMIDALARGEYGYIPPSFPGTELVRGERAQECCAGHASLERLTVRAMTPKGPFSFPMHLFIPTRAAKPPVFVLINFRPDPYDRYIPAEEIVDGGFALAVICYTDITSDDADMQNGLAAMFDRPFNGTGYGKISLWAWAMSRALDALEGVDGIDVRRAAAIGHSRLGKTALWAAACDGRFAYVISNDSGCSGAAYERVKGPSSETVAAITNRFPYWFCENYRAYADRPNDRPFDQHFLLAACAPRYVCVHSAVQDLWADPKGELLSCRAASPAWELFGMPGFIGPEGAPVTDEDYTAGSVGYRMRDGAHFLSRSDWGSAMRFVREHPVNAVR